MATSDTENHQTRKRSPYSFPALVGVVAVVLLILGFSIPGLGWLAWVGFLFLIAAAVNIRLWYFGNWTQTLFNRDKQDNLPPPPSVEQ